VAGIGLTWACGGCTSRSLLARCLHVDHERAFPWDYGHILILGSIASTRAGPTCRALYIGADHHRDDRGSATGGIHVRTLTAVHPSRVPTINIIWSIQPIVMEQVRCRAQSPRSSRSCLPRRSSTPRDTSADDDAKRIESQDHQLAMTLINQGPCTHGPAGERDAWRLVEQLLGSVCGLTPRTPTTEPSG
jgi:hypothetical protein